MLWRRCSVLNPMLGYPMFRQSLTKPGFTSTGSWVHQRWLRSGNLLHSYWTWPFIDIYSGFTHWKQWFSIVMLVYRRGTIVPQNSIELSCEPTLSHVFLYLWKCSYDYPSFSGCLTVLKNIQSCTVTCCSNPKKDSCDFSWFFVGFSCFPGQDGPRSSHWSRQC